MRKLPNPRSSIFSSLRKASTIESKTVFTMISECFLVSSETRATSSTSSAFVMDAPCPLCTASPGRRGALVVVSLVEGLTHTAALLFPPAVRVPCHFPEVDGPSALGLHVIPEFLAVLLLSRGLHGQADLLLGDVHLDDLRGHDV